MSFLVNMIRRFVHELRELGWQGTKARLKWLLTVFLVINGLVAVTYFVYTKTPYRIAYNNTWSMPKGLWVRTAHDDAPYQRGQSVQTHYAAPAWVRQRNWYDPLHTSIIKDIGAVPGDRLRVEGGRIYVCTPPDFECQFLARRLRTDSKHEPMEHVDLPAVVPPRQYFLVGRNPLSLDSRYLGLFGANAIMGHVRPVWVRSIPDEARKAHSYQAWDYEPTNEDVPTVASIPE